MFKLLSTANPKIQKGTKLGYLSFILHLAPADLSGKEVCPKRTAGCTAACLNTAGRGGMFKKGENTNVIQKARIRKTKLFFEDRETFMEQLEQDINKAIKFAARKGLTPVFRLNGTSDLSWEKYKLKGSDKNVFEMFDNIQFYDYTKVLGRKVADYPNYHLTFSAAEGNDADVNKAIAQGMNVTVVFDKIPAEYKGKPVFDADETDLRFLDPKGVVLGLKAKGRAKKDTTGFVVFMKQA
ncbi:MAG: hypothetical protein ACKOPU_03375 [Candidatus Planktophila sp.]